MRKKASLRRGKSDAGAKIERLWNDLTKDMGAYKKKLLLEEIKKSMPEEIKKALITRA